MSDPRAVTLTDEEWAVLEHAKIRGFYVRSGFRLQPLRAWREWCRQNNRPCVIGRSRARDALIEVDNVTVATVPLANLETEAARVAGEVGNPKLADGVVTRACARASDPRQCSAEECEVISA